jgi:hypothetical protein
MSHERPSRSRATLLGVGRSLRGFAIVVALAAAAIALLPFRVGVFTPHAANGDAIVQGRSGSEGAGLLALRMDRSRRRCGPPVVDAWRAPHVRRGWFGYAPLTADPDLLPHFEGDCRGEAQHRVWLAAGTFAAAGLLAFLATRMKPRPAPA